MKIWIIQKDYWLKTWEDHQHILGHGNFQLFIAYRKLTDEIHKYETRLDTLKLDLEEHNTKLAELEKIAQQAQSHHDRNSQALELMKDSSRWL